MTKQKQITLAQAVALLAEREIVGPQGKPYATSTLQKAAREGRLDCQMIGKTYVTTEKAALAWAGAAELHRVGAPKKR